MRRIIAICLVLATAASCSQSPSTPHATESTSPATESTAEGSTAGETTAGATSVVGSDVAIPSDAQVDGGLLLERVSERVSESAPESAPERTSRIAVGDVAPDFRLQDQTGAERSLKDLVAGGKVALVFYRSADW